MCEYCHTECGSINPGMKPEGTGPVLIVLDGVTSEQDFNGSYYAGTIGKLLTDVLKRSGLRSEDCTITSAASCIGNSYAPLDRILGSKQFSGIISFGDASLKALCKKSGIKDKRGNAFPLHKDYGERDVLVWPTYGLGLVRRVPNYLKVVVSDIQRALSSGREAEDIKWSYWE